MITTLNQLELSQVTGGNDTISGAIALGVAALFITARGTNFYGKITASSGTKAVMGHLLSFTICSAITFSLMSFGVILSNTVNSGLHTIIDLKTQKDN